MYAFVYTRFLRITCHPPRASALAPPGPFSKRAQVFLHCVSSERALLHARRLLPRLLLREETPEFAAAAVSQRASLITSANSSALRVA